MKKLILFDIDGTLITAGGAGTRAMNYAFKEIFGINDAFHDITMAGKTDIQIMKEGLMVHGVSFNDGNLEEMKKSYIAFLQREIKNPMKKVKPGIQKTLELFNAMSVPMGLLTGNLEKGAMIKLDACGINHYFIDGAFGSDHENRDNLLPIALERFAARGYSFSASTSIVIGDTPRDVHCAKIHGAFCIAVATGPYSREELQKTDADIVIDSFEERDECLAFIMSPE